MKIRGNVNALEYKPSFITQKLQENSMQIDASRRKAQYATIRRYKKNFLHKMQQQCKECIP